MNVRVRDVGSRYGEIDKVPKKLEYLGITLVRDAFPSRALYPKQLHGFQVLADAGVRFTFVTHNEEPVPDIVADIAAFEKAHPGSVHAIEGPNELNNWPITYKGETGTPAAKSYMKDLYAAVHADPTLKAADVLVYAATDYPDISTMSDVSNLHSYERLAFGSHAVLQYDLTRNLAAFSADPVTPPGPAPKWVVTETGYHTWLGSGWFEGVDFDTQAKLGLGLLLNVAQLGGIETQWYQLWDAWGPPKNGEGAFGVFDFRGDPKPLAIGIRNLGILLSDKGTDARTFTPSMLPHKLSGNLGQQPHDGVYELLMQKSNGQYVLAVWREGTIWDVDNDKPIPLEPKTTTVEFAKSASKVEIFDPLKGLNPLSTLKEVSRVDLALSDRPMLLQISD
jgi:hypothetical protein